MPTAALAESPATAPTPPRTPRRRSNSRFAFLRRWIGGAPTHARVAALA